MTEKFAYSTPLKKLLLAQFGAAVLGLMMSLPTSSMALTEQASLMLLLDLAISLIAVLFLLYIQFTAMWDIGARHKIAVDGGRRKLDMLYGLKSALLANIPNFVLGFVCILAKIIFIITNAEWSESASFVTYLVALLWNGMYLGVLENLIPDANNGWISVLYMCLFFVITIPSIAACTVSYIMGLKGKRIFPEKKKN